MASYNKFENFVGDLGLKVHQLDTDLLQVYLTAAVPSASADTIKTELAEISTGNGYSGPIDILSTYVEASGTGTLQGTKAVVTATGAVTAFRYVVLYNDTPSSPLDPLISWWDYGSTLSLLNGETFSVKFNSSETNGDIFTLV